MGSAAGLLIGMDSLASWRGDLRSYREEWFFGLTSVAGVIGTVAVLALGVLGLRRSPRTAAVALGATVAVALVAAAYFRLRTFGEFFHFKVVAFLFPLLLVAAACWLSERAGPAGGSTGRRLTTVGAAAVLAVGMLAGLRNEVRHTGLQADRATPPGASVRLDVAEGRQLWAGYVLADRPITAIHPITGTTYPYPPPGRKADYIVAERRFAPRGQNGPWPDAAGAPLFENEIFRIYRMRASVPGHDVASQEFR